MKNSALRVSATKRKNGRSASRPNTIRAASASAAGTSVCSRAGPETAPAAARKGAGHHQKRRDGEVLEQKHGEGRAADRRRRAACPRSARG